jgi:hypothetical protein
MVACRLFLFKLKESPRFLAASGRSEEAVVNLGHIAKINGIRQHRRFELSDVEDKQPPPSSTGPGGEREGLGDLETSSSYSALQDEGGPPAFSASVYSRLETDERDDDDDDADDGDGGDRPITRRPAWTSKLPPALAKYVVEYLDRVALLFTPEWARTTTLVWIIWTLASLAYT